MPVLIAALWTALLAIIPTIVGRVLLALGISYVSYRGIDLLMSTAQTAFVNAVSSAGGVTVQIAGILQIGTCISIIGSAAAAKLLVSGLKAGSITKTVMGSSK